MKKISFEDEELVNACRELYMKYGGKRHRQIAEEIRRSGWPDFNRRRLYNHTVRGIHYKGWIERFDWKGELKRRKQQAEARETGKTTFEDWLTAEPTGLKWTAGHHAYICENLLPITDGSAKRLMIFLPPRHGKSELVTVRYLAWRLIRDSRLNIIIGSYNQKLANRFSRKIKQITNERVIRSHARHAAEEWETAVGGSVKAVGVGSGITGFGGDLVVIDDPVKGRAEARSVTLREKIWDWYKDDISTRLEPDAPIILIQTRWHDDDLAGRLLKEMKDGGEQWTVVKLPALAEGEPKDEGGGMKDEIEPTGSSPSALIPHPSSLRSDPLNREPGAALWPERFSREHLLAAKRRLGAWSFASLYQQRPIPDGSQLFKHSWFQNVVSKCPEGLRWARGYDLAVSVHERADYTASFRCALDSRTGTLYIADGFRMRVEYPEQKKFIISRITEEPDTEHGIELALHGKALVQELRREATLLGCVIRGVKVDGDKLMRAEAWSTYAEEGRIVLVNGPWINDFVEEACRFTGRGDSHDDQIDAVSIAVRMLGRQEGSQSWSF